MQIVRNIPFLYIFILFLPLNVHSETIDITSPINNNEYCNALVAANPNIHITEIKFASALRFLPEKRNIAIYETDAIALANIHPDYRFTPHYVQTVVIAIDRDQTSEEITGWKDLLNSTLPINFSFGNDIGQMVWNSPENYHIVTSMSKALYGSYDIKSVAQDFRKIYKSGRFFTNDSSKPISVMYDSKAALLVQEGRNLEIVIPKEGTQSFIAGILHKDPIDFNSPVLDMALVQNGLRLIDGSANSAYPSKEAYASASITENYTEYNKALSTFDAIMRRDSFDIKRYGLANQEERTVAYILCIIIVIMYLISVSIRVTQNNVRNALIIICSLELLLATTQYIKSIVSNSPNLETFLWYAFYFPFTMMPAIFVYVAVITGQTSEKKHTPVLYKYYFFASWAPIIFVATNNLHAQVFKVYDYYHTYFDYNWGYYCVMGWIYLSLMYAIAVLIYKAFQSPRKWAFILPVLSSIIALFYTIGIVLRIPIARDFEVGYGTGIALLLFIESCIQSRLFPVNKGYKKLFTKSSLLMEIKDTSGITILQSEESKKDKQHYVLKEKLIHGGSFLFYEDFTVLHETKEKRAQKNKQLQENNLLLEKKSKVEAKLAVLSTQKKIYKTIDKTLERDTKRISELLEKLKDNKNITSIITQINIIACGIKRECLLRINRYNNQCIKIYDFLLYINEMAEFSLGANLKITMASDVVGEIPSEQGLIMYEVFRLIVEESASFYCNSILAQLYCNNNDIVFSLIANKDISHRIQLQPYKKRVKTLGGNFDVKPWDDTTSFLISFKKGEKISC